MGRLRQWRERVFKALHLDDVPVFVRRAVVAVIGATILLVGVALIVLPGPALVVLPLGLAVLATEFMWARRWLRKGRELFGQAKDRLTGK